MGLRLIWDFTNALDPETGERATRELLEEEFSPGSKDYDEMVRLGITVTIEED